jgi:hypothetical protein
MALSINYRIIGDGLVHWLKEVGQLMQTVVGSSPPRNKKNQENILKILSPIRKIINSLRSVGIK